MDLDYTLISSPRVVADSDDLIKAFGPRGQDQFDVLQIRPSEREVADLRRDDKTIALTPTMPVALIEPILSESSIDINESGTTWGVETVEADTTRFDGRGAIIGVLDTGIQANHAAFSTTELVTQNFTDDASSEDANGHGTHCAGTIAGQNIGTLRIGVAPGIDKLLSGKVLSDAGHGSTTALVKGIQWASMQGAHVISMSLGIDFPAYVDNLHKRRDMELKAAVSMALQAYASNVDMFAKLGDSLSALSYIGQGSLLVAAAGNESKRPRYTIGTSPPAAASSIVSVAAVDQKLNAADFSNTDADLSAPGVQIKSAGLDGGISEMSGTSMAAPHVAGVAALWVQKFLEVDDSLGVERLKATLFSHVKRPEGVAGTDFTAIGRGITVAPSI
jgi:subtilisin family serine protease